MSIFVCARCDGYSDSDDGCEEASASKYPRFSLLCVDCATEEDEQREGEAEERAREFATDQAIGRIKERKMGLDP